MLGPLNLGMRPYLMKQDLNFGRQAAIFAQDGWRGNC